MINRMSTFQTAKLISLGLGTIAKLPEHVKKLGGTKVIIISDPVLEDIGLLKKVSGIFDEANISYETYLGVEPEPRLDLVEGCVNYIINNNCDLVVGLGGGSAMDIAKSASVLATNNGPIDKYFGVNCIPAKGLPMIMIPTTAGTGSEVTAIAILSDEKEELKKGIVSEYLLPDVAIIDPELMATMPPSITAATGMDALTHAVEAYISLNGNFITDALAKEAIALIGGNLRTAVMNGNNLIARENMAVGSLLAGMAFANAGVGAVHALAYPLGGKFKISHGIANSMLLPYVMEYNSLSCLEKFKIIAELLGEQTSDLSIRDSASLAIKSLAQLARDVGIPERLSAFSIPESAIKEMAAAAVKTDRLMANNPRKLSVSEIEKIYQNAY
ncbi:MAG: iron-containing alcohol dehydrogenase [Bacillota bacterium]|nr:iron-containing alcohol dehydrogenase [Bacillota bacterium]